MASLVRRGKFWHVYYRLDGKLRGASTYQVGRAPNEVARQILEKYRQIEGCNKHGLPWVDNATSVSDLVARYWESKPSINAYTATKKKAVLERLCQHMGIKKVTSIGVPECDQFMSTCLGHLHDNSKEAYRALISSLWAWGIKRNYGNKNPWNEIAFKRSPKMPRRSLKPQEIEMIINHSKGSVLLAVLLGLYQGARVGDCVNLHGEDIDFVNKTITFRQRKGSRENAPKIQTLPMHPVIEDVFSKMDLVSGKRLISIRANHLGTKVSNAMRDLGINATHHFLRHTFITIRANAKAGLAQVSQLAGHSSWGITKRYTHLSSESLREALVADQIDNRLTTVLAKTGD